MKYENLLREKEKLEKLLQKEPATGDEHQQLLQLKYKYYQLQQDNKDLKKFNRETEEHHRSAPDPKSVDKTFHSQVAVSVDHYKIPIAIRNKKAFDAEDNGNFKAPNSAENFQIPNDQMSQNVLQQPVPILLNIKSSTPTSVGNKLDLLHTASENSKTKQLPRGLCQAFN